MTAGAVSAMRNAAIFDNHLNFLRFLLLRDFTHTDYFLRIFRVKINFLMEKCMHARDKLNLTQDKHTLPPDKKHLWNRYPIDPDQELLEWERWVNIRNDEITILAKNTAKQPPDLVMNLHEEERDIQEWKTILEHAQIQEKAKIRGNTLWEQPLRLEQECCEDQVYEVQRTRAERGDPRIIEHIGVPEEILETDKGITGKSERKSDKKIDAEFKSYKKRREYELSENIKKIDPFKSEISKLIMRGHRPVPPPPPPPILPLVSVTQYIHTQKWNTSYFALRINNSLFYTTRPDQDTSHLKRIKEKKYSDTCTSWFYYFNTPVKRASKGILILENFGTVAINYYWMQVKRVIPFVPEDNTEQVFFFNKNQDVLFPGQTKKISLTFLTENPGIYNAFWELCLINASSLNSTQDKFVINLYGDSIENADDIIDTIIKQSITIKTIKKRHFARGILNRLIDKITTVEPQAYPYQNMLLEKEMFEMKNIFYFYHQTEVEKLKSYYHEMRPNQEWDLSIVSWRSAMMEKEFDNRMKYYQLLKESHRDLLKPWEEDFDLKKQKYDAVKMLLGNLAKKMDDEYLRLYEITFPKKPLVSKNLSARTNEVEMIPIEMKNIFYMKVYAHLADTMEACAGVVSSLDLCRWIEFDYCKYTCDCQDLYV